MRPHHPHRSVGQCSAPFLRRQGSLALDAHELHPFPGIGLITSALWL
jgi:hypothetical protein